MKLASVASPGGARAACVVGDELVDLAAAGRLLPIATWIPSSMRLLLAGGDEGLAIVARVASAVEEAAPALRDRLLEAGILRPLAATQLAAPVPDPGILLSHARAYRDHIAEMDKAQAPPKYPVGFPKNVHSMTGHDATIPLPPSAAGMVDFEGEISFVFGRPCHGVTAAEALDHIVGVTIVNDVSARDWATEIREAPDRNRMGKQFPGFSPMGPWIATKDELGDLDDLHLVTRVNGQIMQDARSSDLIWGIGELIEYYARWYPFQPGDVLTTGSPAGVGYGRNPKLFLKAGDTVSITVDGVGTLSNRIGEPA